MTLLRAFLAAALALLPLGVGAQTISNPPSGVVPDSLSAQPQYANSSIFTSSAAVTMATAAELSCFGAGIGSQTIPANSVVVGTKFRISCLGVYTTPAANTATVTVKFKWGTTVIGTATTGAMPASQTGTVFAVNGDCTFRSIGAAGSVACTGTFIWGDGLIAAGSHTGGINATTTIDTTAAAVLDATWTWSSVAGSQTATGNQAGLQVVN